MKEGRRRGGIRPHKDEQFLPGNVSGFFSFLRIMIIISAFVYSAGKRLASGFFRRELRARTINTVVQGTFHQEEEAGGSWGETDTM